MSDERSKGLVHYSTSFCDRNRDFYSIASQFHFRRSLHLLLPENGQFKDVHRVRADNDIDYHEHTITISANHWRSPDKAATLTVISGKDRNADHSAETF